MSVNFSTSTHHNHWFFTDIATVDEDYKENMRIFYDTVKEMVEHTHTNRGTGNIKLSPYVDTMFIIGKEGDP